MNTDTWIFKNYLSSPITASYTEPSRMDDPRNSLIYLILIFFLFSVFLKLEKFGEMPVIKLNHHIYNLLCTAKPGRMLKRQQKGNS